MDALTHLNESRNLTVLSSEFYSRGQYLAAGELVWGAIVHAVSAAARALGQQVQSLRFRGVTQM